MDNENIFKIFCCILCLHIFPSEFGVSEVVVTLNTDTDIYVHSQDHFYHPTTTAKVSVSIGQLMFCESIRGG